MARPLSSLAAFTRASLTLLISRPLGGNNFAEQLSIAHFAGWAQKLSEFDEFLLTALADFVETLVSELF